MENSAQGVRSQDQDSLDLLHLLKSEAFKGSNEELALALGRPAEEIESWLNGEEDIDEDAAIKINGLVQTRLRE